MKCKICGKEFEHRSNKICFKCFCDNDLELPDEVVEDEGEEE